MTKIERLYGVKKAIWRDLPYEEALKLKIACANNVISLIHAKNYTDVTNDDTKRKNECLRAIKHNKELLDE